MVCYLPHWKDANSLVLYIRSRRSYQNNSLRYAFSCGSGLWNTNGLGWRFYRHLSFCYLVHVLERETNRMLSKLHLAYEKSSSLLLLDSTKFASYYICSMQIEIQFSFPNLHVSDELLYITEKMLNGNEDYTNLLLIY